MEKTPNGKNAEWKKRRMEKTPNGKNAEWKKRQTGHNVE
jgi:surface antigen